MKIYKCIMIERYIQDTQRELNRWAKDGWKVVCSYGRDNIYLILEKEQKQKGSDRK